MIRTLFALAVVVGGPCALRAAQVDHMVVFGDSFSDNGNDYAKTGSPAPTDYTKGRATDGPDSIPSTQIVGLWEEQLAPLVNLPVPQANIPNPQGLNFSFSGAETSTVGNQVSGTGMSAQVSQYLAASPAGIGTALHVFWGGTNDLFDYSDPVAEEQTAIQNISNEITSVINAGGTYFVWLNLPPLNLTPRGAGSASLQTASANFSTDMQSAISSLKAAHPGVTIISVDVYSLYNKVIQNPAAYGFTNVTATAQQQTSVNPDQYVFWDNLHPTTRMHQLIANLAQSAISGAVTTPLPPGGAPVSDEFSGTALNTSLWAASTPAGGTVAESNGALQLSVPGGSNHDAFVGGDNSVRILQNIANADFDVAAKFNSAVSGAYQGQGILVQQDASTYLRFELYSTGDGLTYALAASISGSNQVTTLNQALSSSAVPMWLQVARAGSTWTLSTSTDGATYTSVGNFSQALTATAIGPYAWNYNSTPTSAPALASSVDWFHNLNAATQATAPAFSPGSESFSSAPISVTLSDATPGAAIYYTTDGSTPTTASAKYSAAISLSGTTTINAMAVASGYSNSPTASSTYTYTPVQTAAAAPVFSPGGGSYSGAQTVTLSDATAGATIYYTVDGSNPSTSSPVYSSALTVSSTETVRAFATASGDTASSVAQASYTIGAQGNGTGISLGSGFTAGSVTLNGSAKLNGTRLRLTDGGGYEASSAFYPSAVNVQSFTSDFTFQLTSPSADGFAFVIQGVGTNALGSYGGALGYGPQTPGGTGGIAKSIAVKFDLYSNGGEGSDSTGIFTNGAYPTTPSIDLSSTAINLHSGDAFSVHLAYDGTTLTVTITDTATSGSATQSYTINIPSTVGASTAYVGFTGGTGGLTATQDILSWTFTPQGSSPSPAATPAFSPGTETFSSSPLSVSLSDTTSGATIYYTTDNSTPTTGSAIYSGPLSITGTTTVKAIATASGFSTSAVGSATYTYSAAATGVGVSDDFNGTSLNTSLWAAKVPSGGSASVANGHLTIVVPGGSNHQPYAPALNAARVVQAVSNADFDVAIKLDSQMTASTNTAYEGILAGGDGSNWIYYTLQSNGSSIGLLAASVDAGTQNIHLNAAISGYSVPTYLRLKRSGSTYTAYWSTDAVNWTQAASFSDGLVLTHLGPMAGNYNATPANAPAVTASVDWFYNLTTTNPSPTPTASTPSFSPGSESFSTAPLSVSISDGTSGASIYYTSNGNTPTTSSTKYTGPISLSATTTLKAIAVASGYLNSAVASATYTYSPVTSGGPVSDNFDSGHLNTSLWTLENPLGDGSVTTNNTAAMLNVPHGTQHNLWTSADNAVRIMQPIANSDFGAEVRFQSNVSIGNQDEGILVEQDSGTFLRFDVYNNGTSAVIFAAGVSGTSGQVFLKTSISIPNAPIWLRLSRSGSQWTGSWSTDGVTFNATPSFAFSMNVARIGPFAATISAAGSYNPAFTAVVDYFFNTGSRPGNNSGPGIYKQATVDANPASTLVEKTLADIRGSGHLNPVIGMEYPSNGGIYWYDYPSTGGATGVWTKHTIVGSGNAYEEVAALDVNNDGAVDVLASYDPTNTGNYSLIWFQNPRGNGGDPAVDTWTQHVIGATPGENNMVLADIDGDGKIDIVTASYIFFQDSPTSWTKVQYNSSFRGEALLDIGSGHGAINVVGTGPSAPYNTVWFENPRETGGNARTGTWLMHTIGPGYTCPNSTACPDGNDVAVYNAADLNGDGQMDVIVAQSEGPNGSAPPPGGLMWFQAPSDRRNGTWVQHVIDSTFVDAHKISVADMDKNGTTDIVTSEQDQAPFRRVSVFYNDGKGNFNQQVLSNAEGHNQVVGDINGDGHLDILNSGHGYYGDPHPLQIYLNPY